MSVFSTHDTQQAYISKIIDLNGGHDLWYKSQFVQIKLAFGGLAFWLKQNMSGKSERIAKIFIHQQKAIFDDYPKTGYHGIYTPDKVAVFSPAGDLVQERLSPRNYFANSFRRIFHWDNLDLLYFAGYACWNYFTMPFLLLNEGIEIIRKTMWEEDGEDWTKLTVQFPEYIHTHSPVQSFYFDYEGQLRRHDYTPIIFSPNARAAHYCYNHQHISGVQFPTLRKVYPHNSKGIPQFLFPILWIKASSLLFNF